MSEYGITGITVLRGTERFVSIMSSSRAESLALRQLPAFSSNVSTFPLSPHPCWSIISRQFSGGCYATHISGRVSRRNRDVPMDVHRPHGHTARDDRHQSDF